ncbi:colicin V production protein [Pontibacter qinzhouensis]|uniref:Colicin V production protein n=1 Tax=Pontibacter qinzhouensis TaxID=2603253 RepID=A0A5C8J2A9_9BACT|nr:CvpA family protein [Pontibacter qinzhouensis]TXK28599.1 colicin V production protein [Pontibacter qinzhouensis]
MYNVVDLFFIIIMLVSVVTGWRRGFIIGTLDLVRWVASLLIGLQFYPALAGWLGKMLNWTSFWLLPVSFFMVTMLASVLIHFLFDLVLTRLPASVHHSKVNQALGLVPGAVSGLVTAIIIAMLLLAVPLPEAIETRVEQSPIANRLVVFTDKLETALGPAFDEVAQRTLTGMTVVPDSEGTVELPFTVTNVKPRPDLEAQMLELLNKERVAVGLQPLVADTVLREVARQHATDMFSRGYFSHHSPEGLDAFDRIRQAHIPFRIAGENLALAPTLPIAHEGLMNSPGHRANILQRRFGRVGIGIMEGGSRRLMITQNFRN